MLLRPLAEASKRRAGNKEQENKYRKVREKKGEEAKNKKYDARGRVTLINIILNLRYPQVIPFIQTMQYTSACNCSIGETKKKKKRANVSLSGALVSSHAHRIRPFTSKKIYVVIASCSTR